MGQLIQLETETVGDVIIVDANRSITGQDGIGYPSVEDAAADDRFPGVLASRIFESDSTIDHVFVGSNGIVVRRRGGFDAAASYAVEAVIRNFFVFYDENRG